MSVTELEEVKRYLLDNLNKGFIEPSQSPFAAPVLFVKKANGSLRFCIDYRKLTQLTRKDRCPIPLLDETLARGGVAPHGVETELEVEGDPAPADLYGRFPHEFDEVLEA